MGQLIEALASRRRAVAIWQKAVDVNPAITIAAE